MTKILNREIYLYTIFGLFTTLLNIGLFQILSIFICNYKFANMITLMVVKIVAYICNKFWVFKSKTDNFKELAIEFGKFVYTRLITLLIDYFGLILLVDVVVIPKLLSKIIVVLIVIIINYVVGKNYVFKKGALK